MSGGVFLLLSNSLTDTQFFNFGWRIPFLASALLVGVGLYVRLTIGETPVFHTARATKQTTAMPMVSVFRNHRRALLVGTLMSITTFVLFYLMTVFALSWGTTALGFSRGVFLKVQLWSMVLFALGIPLGGRLAEYGRRKTLLFVTLAIGAFGLVLGPLFAAGLTGASTMMAIGLGLMGITYGPIGTALSELFPTHVRYTGSSLTFNLGGIFGASLAPYVATWLAKTYGINYVGYYLSIAALITIVGVASAKETKDEAL
jgi:MFS family permease